MKPPNFLELSFKSNSGARFYPSHDQWIIDVFPNMVPIVIYIMLSAIDQSNKVDHRGLCKSSAATICIYHLSVVYGYFLINDVSVRPTPSAHARSWKEISWKRDFIKVLSALSVPDFLVPILSQFHAFSTERTNNLFFIPSAAGYDHNQFFGRVFPLNMFAAVHDCTATLFGDVSRETVLRELYSRSLYTIGDPAYTCVIPDLIGVSIDQTNATTQNYMNSKLFNVFNSVFNQVLYSDFEHRTTIVALSLSAPAFPTDAVNAYDMMFAATPSNLHELEVVFQSVSYLIKDHVPSTKTLGEFISENTGSQILKHGYSTFALPTWSHNEVANKTTIFSNATVMRRVSTKERAQDFCFLQRPDVGFPLCNNNDVTVFSDDVNTTPRVLVLDTDGDLTATAYLATLSGKIIESFELDGTTIEMPNIDKPLCLQNTMFADSAIPYRYVRPGSHYRPHTAGSILPPLNRVKPESRPRLPASSMLYDRTVMMLPVINRAINETGPVNVLRSGQSFLGFKTVDGSNNADNLDDVPGMDEGHLILWSPYTYTSYESSDYPTPNLSASRHYYLTNLRTLLGTDYNLIEVKHPYKAMPFA